jgi:hypothetical protein
MSNYADARCALALLSLLLAGCVQNQIFGAGGSGTMGTCKVATDSPSFSPISYDATCYSPAKADALHACPKNYYFDGVGCRCGDDSICGLSCKTSADCGEPYLACDVPAATCRPVFGCFSNAACPAGTACLHGQAEDTDVCLPLGAAAVGASCGWNGDCASGVCVSDNFGPAICVPACRKMSDCPSGLVCAAVETQYAGPPWQFAANGGASWDDPCEPTTALGCVAEASCTGCSGDQFCDGTACAVSCTRSADCTSGGCLASASGGRCDASATGCAPMEAFVSAPAGMGGPCSSAGMGGPSGFCIDYASCYADDACAPGYQCVPNINPNAAPAGAGDGGIPGLCARARP